MDKVSHGHGGVLLGRINTPARMENRRLADPKGLPNPSGLVVGAIIPEGV